MSLCEKRLAQYVLETETDKIIVCDSSQVEMIIEIMYRGLITDLALFAFS